MLTKLVLKTGAEVVLFYRNHTSSCLFDVLGEHYALSET